MLVGNFGDGKINVFNLPFGTFIGSIQDKSGKPIVIDGLWGLSERSVSGDDEVEGGDQRIFFTAGLNHESDRLLGYLTKSDD